MNSVDFIFDADAYNITSDPKVQLSHSETLFKTQLTRAYQCSHVDIKDLANVSVSNVNAMVNIETFELQAFSFSNTNGFDPGKFLCHS